MIPSPWVALVIALGVYRVVRLVGWDDLQPVARIRAWAVGETITYNVAANRDNAIYRYKRPTLNHFLNCPFCQGFWWSLVTYATWVAIGGPGAIDERSWMFYVVAPFALSGAVGLLAKNLDA